MLYCFSGSSVKFLGHTGQKIADFDLNWEFPDCNSSLNSLIVFKWCTELAVVWKRCCIVFQGHLSNFKVTQDKKITNFYPDWGFPDCNSSLNSHIWWWNDAQSLMWHRKGTLLFIKVIHQMSRSHGTKNIADFEPNWVFPDCNSSLNSLMATERC